MSEECQFLSIMLETLPAFLGIAGLPDALNHLFKVVLDVVLDGIDLDDVLSEVVVLYVCDLRVFIPLLSQIVEMIGLHLFDDLPQPVVEG